ncbi:unnamed protein product [Closterium sp. NIES-64]|nr:unnamed protein product [Closterium sp. NIES-64]
MWREVTTLSALIAPSAVAAVTGADVSSVAEAAAAAGAAVGTAGDGALASLSQLFLLGALSLADEPSNALSLPTWIIHVASVVEWVVAMALVWQYGAAESRRAWRGLIAQPSLVVAMALVWQYGAAESRRAVVAMALVWQYGAAESRRAWRGLAWAMVPLLMGAMCAVHVALLLQLTAARGLQLVPCRVLFCDAVEGPRMGHGASSYGGHVCMLVALFL